MADALGLGKAAESAAKLVKPVYEDLAQPTVREVGSFVGETVVAILLPIRKAMEQYTEVVDQLSDKVAHKLRGIPAERLTPPPANVAGPLLEAVRFVPPDSPLHELYSNLLARSMDSKTARVAHPAFVAIIGQLTPDEARILTVLVDSDNIATITVDDIDDATDPEHGESWDGVLRNFTLVGYDAGCTAPELATAYLDNLVRLGVLESQAPYQLADKERYRRLEESEQVLEAAAAVSEQAGHKPRLSRSFVNVTDFGRLLIEASVRAPAP